MVLVKIGHFFIFLFLANRGKKNMFYDILERKNLFLGYKKIQVQKLKKIETIPKEVNPWFGQKMAIFPTSFLVI